LCDYLYKLSYLKKLSNAQNPLHMFTRNIPVDGEVANLLWTC